MTRITKAEMEAERLAAAEREYFNAALTVHLASEAMIAAERDLTAARRNRAATKRKPFYYGYGRPDV